MRLITGLPSSRAHHLVGLLTFSLAAFACSSSGDGEPGLGGDLPAPTSSSNGAVGPTAPGVGTTTSPTGVPAPPNVDDSAMQATATPNAPTGAAGSGGAPSPIPADPTVPIAPVATDPRAPEPAAPLLAPGSWGDQGDGTFINPVLWSDYNNLDVISQGEDFYMIAAAHHFMGMPVLRSKDMVNWTLISRIYRNLEIDDRYDQPGQAYQHGAWAPAIRFNEGKFFVYVTTPVEGLLMTTATDPAGPWAPWRVVMNIADWEDPCPFWDDVPNAGGDGPEGRQAYLVRSQLRAGPLIIQRMSWDGTSLLGPLTTVATGPTLEGPKLHKRNGLYFIFAPEGGIDNGYQVVLRSASILGPYEKRTILERGSTDVNGQHQGSWLDLPSGQSWFFHFQQRSGWGRIAHLEPGSWTADDWPQAGIDLDGNGIGEPVRRPSKPDVGGEYPLTAPQSSDEFDGANLGLQWLWNHNPDPTRWSLTERPGWLRLTAQRLANESGRNGADGGNVPFREDSIVFAYNTLVQLAMGNLASAVVQLDPSGMINGQRAGVTLFGQSFGWVGILRENDASRVVANLNGTYSDGPELSGDTIFLRAQLDTDSSISFAYSFDGQDFTPLGGSLVVGRTWFEGIKFGLFSYNLSDGTAGGTADFDFLHYTHDGPQPAP